MVIPFRAVFNESIVHEVERVNGLEKAVCLTGFHLLHIRLRGVEEHPAHEAGSPKHLHLDDELPFLLIYTARINDVLCASGTFGTK